MRDAVSDIFKALGNNKEKANLMTISCIIFRGIQVRSKAYIN